MLRDDGDAGIHIEMVYAVITQETLSLADWHEVSTGVGCFGHSASHLSRVRSGDMITLNT